MLPSDLFREALFFLEFEALLARADAWNLQAQASPAGWLFLIALFPLR